MTVYTIANQLKKIAEDPYYVTAAGSAEILGIINSTENISPSPIDARVACADSTNNACPAGLAKSDDPGRGGFVVEGGYAVDRDGRMRGPITIIEGYEQSVHITDKHGSNHFYPDGKWMTDRTESDHDLVGPWIDWKAECERLERQLIESSECLNCWVGDGAHEASRAVLDRSRAALARLASLKGEGAGA